MTELIAYGDKPVSTFGKTWVEVNAFATEMTPIFVTRMENISLFGLDWVLKKYHYPRSQDLSCKSTFREKMPKPVKQEANRLISDVLIEFSRLFEDS